MTLSRLGRASSPGDGTIRPGPIPAPQALALDPLAPFPQRQNALGLSRLSRVLASEACLKLEGANIGAAQLWVYHLGSLTQILSLEER